MNKPTLSVIIACFLTLGACGMADEDQGLFGPGEAAFGKADGQNCVGRDDCAFPPRTLVLGEPRADQVLTVPSTKSTVEAAPAMDVTNYCWPGVTLTANRFYWDGSACAGIAVDPSTCWCEGEDCDRLYSDANACHEAHSVNVTITISKTVEISDRGSFLATETGPYLLTVDEPGPLSITVSDVADDQAYRLVVQTPTGRQLRFDNRGLIHDTAQPGTYKILVEGFVAVERDAKPFSYSINAVQPAAFN